MTVLSAFQMLINYGQIAVHRPDEPDCFTHWTQADVDRGHVARDGHVVFGVEDQDGLASVTVVLGDAGQRPGAHAIPFEVKAGGVIVATPVGFDEHVAAPPGRYLLSCEITPLGEEGVSIELRFRSAPA